MIAHGEKSQIYVVYTPTNALFMNLVKSIKFTLKYTIISLLHVSVFNDHHQGDLSVPNESYIYKYICIYKYNFSQVLINLPDDGH